MSRNSLATGRKNRADEFYTKYNDVKFELDHYLDLFKDKVIYCPCDGDSSAFTKYFSELKSQSLIKDFIHTSLDSGVDFLSDAAIENYHHCDIVVTNPPFSLFRPFIELLDKLDKRFILWGNNNALTYHIVAKLLKTNRIGLGYICNKACSFLTPYSEDGTLLENNELRECVVSSCSTFTNIATVKPELECSRSYDPAYYQKYDNYDAINVDKVKDIPLDYYEPMGVPITYLSKHNPTKFEIIGIFNNFNPDPDNGLISGERVAAGKIFTRGPVVNGEAKYARVVIRRLRDDCCR